MNPQLKQGITIFLGIVFGAIAIFYAFVPYSWICEYQNVLGLGTTCQVNHLSVFFIAVGFFMLSILAIKGFDFKNIFTGSG